MTITAIPATYQRKNAAINTTLYAHTTDPGTFAVTYPTGITGPATVTVAGTRVWRNGLKHGQYLAREGASTAGRLDVSFCFEINKNDITGNNMTTFSKTGGGVRNSSASVNRDNYMFVQSIYGDSIRIQYWESATDAANTAQVGSLFDLPRGTLATPFRFVVTLTSADKKVNTYYTDGINPKTTLSRSASIAGTTGGVERLIVDMPIRVAKFDRLLDQADRTAWIVSNTLPATPALSLQGGHEIQPATPRFYDTSGNDLDLSDVDVTRWPEAAASGDYTDTDFASPIISIPVTLAADLAAGDHVITLRRARVGVPARTPALPDAELYDDGSLTVTVSVESEAVTIGPDIDCQVPSLPATFDVLISSNYDGVATVVSDDPALVPTSPVTISGGVATCACTVSADVTAATVTVTGPGGDTDTCTVTVSEVPPAVVPLTIGPDQTLDALVDEIYLHLTGEDGPVSLSAVPAFGLSGLPASASIADGVATVTVRRMTAGTYTITATQGTSSASCTITIPSVLVPSDDYDLRLDLADIIEAIQVPASRSAYHYDETMKSDGEALDAEDGTFSLHVIQTVDGPIIGGSTAVVLVQVAIETEPDHADMERFREAIHEARMPPYVSSIYCESGDVTPMRGAYLVQYMMQVQLA